MPVDISAVPSYIRRRLPGEDIWGLRSLAARIEEKANISGLASGAVPVAASGVVTAEDGLGVGSVSRAISAELVDQPRSIASFKTLTGDYETAFNDALVSGEKHLFVPHGLDVNVSATHTISASTQLAINKGARLVAQSALINALTFGGDDISLVGPGSIVCGGGYSGGDTGLGIRAISRLRCKVQGVTFTNHRGMALLARDCEEWEVSSNKFLSANMPVTPDDSNCFADIYFVGSSQGNSIHHNFINSGQGFGIAIFSTDGVTSIVADNEIASNRIKNAVGYGIAIYKKNTADTFAGNIISSNRVKDITGALYYSAGPDRRYGAGIYVQGADGTLVALNKVRNTCQLTENETLAPGCIGVTNTRAFQLIGNECSETTMYGYHLGDPNEVGDAGESSIIMGNVAHHCTLDGFKLNSPDDYQLISNLSYLNGQRGISITGGGTTTVNVTLTDNTMKQNGSHGFETAGTTITRLTMRGNHSRDNTLRGYQINTAISRCIFDFNEAYQNGGTDIVMSASVLLRSFKGNVFDLNSGVGSIATIVPDGTEVITTSSAATKTLNAWSSKTQYLTAILDATRTITLPTGSGLQPGHEFEFIRAAGATGGFNWVIGSIINLGTEKTKAKIKYTSAGTWLLTEYSTLP